MVGTMAQTELGSAVIRDDREVRVGVAELRFLARVCGRRPYVRPCLIADGVRSHFTVAPVRSGCPDAGSAPC